MVHPSRFQHPNGRSVRPVPISGLPNGLQGPGIGGGGEIQHQFWTKSGPQQRPHLGRGRLRWCRPLLSPAGHCRLCSWSSWTEFQLGSASCKPSRYPGLAKVPGQQQRPQSRARSSGLSGHLPPPNTWAAKDSAVRVCPTMHGRIRLDERQSSTRLHVVCANALDSTVARLGKALL